VPFVSVTRLRLRGWSFLPRFALHTFRSSRQIARTPGFRAGQLAGEPGLGFWTVTLWDDAASMRAFRNGGAHLVAMRGLIEWCSEGSYAHWEAEAAELPSPAEAHRRMLAEGKLSKVNHPSSRHAAGATAGDALPKVQQVLKPAR
jgi:hypothetical protein